MSNEYPIGFQIPEHNLKLAIVFVAAACQRTIL